MPGFARQRPELAVDDVEVVSALSDAARDKAIDAAQVCITICGESLLVDIMPTIGYESYDEADRVPRRDPRGDPESDSLRRDLTIGSMLLQVTKRRPARAGILRRRARIAAERLRLRFMPAADAAAAAAETAAAPSVADDDIDGGGVAESTYATAAAAVASAADLQFVLLDFHGGIEDVSTRVLRAPVPRDASLGSVYSAAVVTPRDAEIAAQLGLDQAVVARAAGEVGGVSEVGKVGGAAEGEEAAAGAPVEQADADFEAHQQLIQTLWWGKMLREDPLRLLRALRFSATLGFRLHASFWAAAPFALQPGALDTKVSHTRKLSELYKMAKAGPAKLVDFFAIVFDPVS